MSTREGTITPEPRKPWEILNALRAAEKLEPETGHQTADALLIELLRWAYYIGEIDDLTRDQFEDIIEAYESVFKWYA